MKFSVRQVGKFSSIVFLAGTFFGCGDDADPIIAPSIISVRPMSIDFGKVPVGNTLRKEIVVYNTGQKVLNVTRVKFTGTTGAFSLTQVPGAVEPNDKKSGLLEFRPDNVGEFSAVLIFESNADNNTAYQVMVRGEGIDTVICGDCASPPENLCLSDFDLRLYDLIGLCEGGLCKYQERVISCPNGCLGNDCVDYSAPTATVSIVPQPAYTKDKLTVSATVTTFDLESTTLRYEWFRNQILIPEETTDRIDSSRTSKGITARR